MIKKYYDNNNYLVGISYGEITENVKETSFEDISRVLNLLQSLPTATGYKTHLIEEDVDGFINYDYIYEQLLEDELSDIDLKNLFKNDIFNSIIIDPKPRTAAKIGYILKPYLSGNHICWEFVEDDRQIEEKSGTYLDPIPYIIGMSIIEGFWYTNGENIWESRKSGVPKDFADADYFDIV